MKFLIKPVALQALQALLITFYIAILLALVIFSYTFVDPNLTLLSPLHLALEDRLLSTTIFVAIIASLFFVYLFLIISRRGRKIEFPAVRRLILITIAILFFSYPAFSYDIFNYILTAKVAYFYQENPYSVMPIELLGEPNLAFTRAANKIALYGPTWIGLTFFPHVLGFGNILTTIFSFKLLIVLFFMGTSWLIFKLTNSTHSLILFALNPLVIVETLVSGHNDIVMMFFALLAFYFLKRRKILVSTVALLASALIKYATLFLFPVFAYVTYKTIKAEKLQWDKIYMWCTISLLAVFAMSPIREEIYSWYVIWILAFAVLIPKQKVLISLAVTLSFATLLRYAPVLFTGSYFGLTPIIKEIVTFVPLVFLLFFWLWRKFSAAPSPR